MKTKPYLSSSSRELIFIPGSECLFIFYSKIPSLNRGTEENTIALHQIYESTLSVDQFYSSISLLKQVVHI